MPANPAPSLKRDIELHMMGDWGIANLHRICGWLSAEMGLRSGSGSRFATWNGRGGADAIKALLSRRVDLALFVPACLGRAALKLPQVIAAGDPASLRAIGVLPQTDALVIAVDAGLGINSLSDMHAKKPSLRIAAAVDDGVNMVGYATHRLLDLAGLSRQVIESWGGSFLEGEAPWDVIPLATEGKADAVIFEAIMTPYWRDLTARREMIFLPLEEDLLRRFEANYAVGAHIVPAGRFKGQTQPLPAADFSDFLLLARDDLDSDIAWLLAWCLCETRGTIEAQYRHLAPENSPLTYPLDPRKIASSPLPLHPGAARYFSEAKLI